MTTTLLLALIALQTIAAQTPEPVKPDALPEETRRRAVELLRETSAEIGNLRSLENRIGLSSEIAGLMWFHDDREALAMYQAVIGDFKQLLAGYDAQLNMLANAPKETVGPRDSGPELDEQQNRLRQQLEKAMGVRRQIATTLAEHEPTLAFDFFDETVRLVTDQSFREQMAQRDSYLETEILKKVAVKDPAKAVALGRRSIEKGVGWQHAELLRKIYDKDPEKGAEFAGELVKRIRADKASPENVGVLTNFLYMGSENAARVKRENGKRAMFTDQQLRELAERLVALALENKESLNGLYEASSTLALIEKYAPGRLPALRAKYPELFKARAPVAETAPTAVPMVAPTVAPTPTPTVDPAEAARVREQEEMAKNYERLGKKELTKEERERFVEQSRKIIGGIGRRQEKLLAVGMLAAQLARAGDKELAAEVMRDAVPLINPAPRNYRDFMEIWMLAGGYAAADPDKAFPLLDDVILRLNDTIAAFVKVGDFMDLSGELVDDGEIQVGAFGGSMVNSLTRDLGNVSDTMRNLALADFDRTRALANRFERTEVRVLAKMLILRGLLGGPEKRESAEVEKADPAE